MRGRRIIQDSQQLALLLPILASAPPIHFLAIIQKIIQKSRVLWQLAYSPFSVALSPALPLIDMSTKDSTIIPIVIMTPTRVAQAGYPP
jgi:hypothetical protein